MSVGMGEMTGISVEDVCYETGLISGNPIGICTNCGNGICEEIETVCGCPTDCVGEEKSDFLTVQDFCDTGYTQYCVEEITLELDLCQLCP